MYKISIDLGYGYVKGVGEDGKTILFPSIVGPGKDRGLSEALGSANTGLDKLHVEMDGKQYFVGDLAITEAGGLSTSTLEGDKIQHEHTKTLLAVATSLLVPQGYKNYHLVTGLPLRDHIAQADTFDNMLRNYNTKIKFMGGPAKGRTLDISFAEVTVFPQAAGVVYNSELLNEIQRTEQYIAVIDIGYKTTDFVVFSTRNGALDFRDDISQTLNIGMSFVISKLQDEFIRRTGTRLPYSRVFMLLEKQSVVFKGERMDFTDFIENAKKELADYIIEAVKNSWRDETNFIERTYLAGGSAIAMQSHLKNFHPNTVLVKDAQMANARGFLNFVQMSERANKIRRNI